MLYVGIDIGKRAHEATLLDENGQQQGKSLRFANTREGAAQLFAHLNAGEQPAICGMEATGHYWLALYEYLRQAGLDVVVVNPLQTSAYRTTFLRKTKTDRRDSWVIADLIRIGRARATIPPDQLTLQIRELSRFRFSLIDQIADLKRKALSILDRVFPEYETLFTDVFRKGSRALLARAATAEEIAAFDLGELTGVLRTASQGQFREEKARQIKEAAENSLGVSFLADAVRVELRCLLDHLAFLEEQVAEVDAHVAGLVQQTPAGSHLLSIPGVGPALAAAILGEVGEIRRFETPEKLVAFAGLDPSIHQSGQFSGTHAAISKRGSPYLRRAIWLAALPARQRNPDLQEIYERKISQGKCYPQAMAAVAHRLLNRIYIVLKEQRPYVVRAKNDQPDQPNAELLDSA
jgi:transposase